MRSLRRVLLNLLILTVPYSAVLQHTKYKVSNLTKSLILASSPFVDRAPWAVEYGSPVQRNNRNEADDDDMMTQSSNIHEVRIPYHEADRLGKSVNDQRKKTSFDYKYEEPLYTDTQPRFFKKTLDTISGFLTHTFSSDDAKQEKKKVAKKPVSKPKKKPSRRPSVMRNPLENIKPLKFPSAIHNYQEVSHNSPSNVKDDVRKSSDPGVMTSHKSPGTSLHNNEWKPSQRLSVATLFHYLISKLFQILSKSSE